MRLLVTGGAGYIGSVTVRKLRAAGHTVTVFDVLENGHRQAVPAGVPLIVGDLRRVGEIESLLAAEKFEAVIHFAGYIESGESMKNPLVFFQNNFSGGLNLLSAMEKYGPKQIIFSSTAGVYGTGQPPFTESSPIGPTSYYSLSKYFFEEALRAACAARAFKAVILRYFNAAGATWDGCLGEDHDPETHLIPLVIQTALGRRGSLPLYGTDYPTPDGTAVRDYVHVEDLATAHVLSLSEFAREPGYCETYNVGTGEGYSNRQVIAMVKTVLGRDFEVVEKPRREGDWAASLADVSKIERRLGFRPRWGLKEIVESACLWHQSHPQGFP